MHNIDSIIYAIDASDSITLEDSFGYAQLCSSLLYNGNKDGNRLIINILNNWQKINPATSEVWTDLIESAGFYPYLEKEKERLNFNNLPGEIRKELHLSEHLPHRYFHEEQRILLELLNSGKNVIVSAPTSFGKSLLIEEVVASKKFQNIVIIQPTLALLDETRRKLLKYSEIYKLIVRTSQEPSDRIGNIFLFTAERVNEYSLFTQVDFLVIDEFYKLSGQRDDERSSSLNNAFYHLLENYNPKFYLLGPNIDGISPGFAETHDAIFHKSEYSLVDSREINLYEEYKGKFGSRGKRKDFKEQILFEVLDSLLSEQTIIYCSSPVRVRELSKKYYKYLEEKGRPQTQNTYPLIDWVKKYVSQDWSLISTLMYDIGIHDGALQKHITTSIIDYFNNGLIKYLFCTSTIIEGVNTSAKNIIYFDQKKGPNEVDYFDYSNIKGRAGRMMEHYVGRIFNFNPPPEKKDVIIDIPFYQQNPIKDEVLIQLKEDAIKDKKSDQYKSILVIPQKEKEIIKRNGLSVGGQKNIFEILRSDIKTKYNLIAWTQQPQYKQLEYAVGLAWDNLLLEGESTKPMSKGWLVNLTFNYGYHKSIDYLVNSYYNHLVEKKPDENKADLKDEAIQIIFQTMKHWFQYKVPKWLSVMHEIQRFVCAESGVRAGNYAYYATAIENDFLQENMAILTEYGIPPTAIKKLSNYIPSEVSQDEILHVIKAKKLYDKKELITYERNKLLENLK